jgi:hypothetical protein
MAGPRGKIDSLPFELREQVNRKLRDGVPALKICAWLNSLPEVLTILDESFGEEPITPQNISNWKANGYAKWLARQEKIDRTRELSAHCIEVAKAAGGNISDGVSQIIAGNILEVLEMLDALREQSAADVASLTVEERKAQLSLLAESIDSLALAVARLRKGDQNAETLKLHRERLAQAEQSLKLEREKWELKLREYEEKVAAQKQKIVDATRAARAKGGLTPETLKEIEEAAAIL